MTAAAEREIAEGRQLQDAIRAALATLARKGRYMDRDAFEADMTHAAKRAGVKVAATEQEGDLRRARRA